MIPDSYLLPQYFSWQYLWTIKMKKKLIHCRNNSTIKYQNRRKRSNVYPRYKQINDDSHSWLGIVSAGVTVFTNDSR